MYAAVRAVRCRSEVVEHAKLWCSTCSQARFIFDAGEGLSNKITGKKLLG